MLVTELVGRVAVKIDIIIYLMIIHIYNLSTSKTSCVFLY